MLDLVLNFIVEIGSIIGSIIEYTAALLLIVATIVLINTYIVYQKIIKLNEKEYPFLKNNLSQSAKTIFRWNILARMLFIKTMKNIYEKEKENVYTKYKVDKCQVFFTEYDRQSIQNIKRKFRQLSKIYHPDKGGTTEQFNDLTSCKNQINKGIKKC